MKLRVQAQYLQPGDIVGSGETVNNVQEGLNTPKGKCEVVLNKTKDGILFKRIAFWGKYTMINVERKEKVE